MPIVELDVEPTPLVPPSEILDLLTEADRRIEAFVESRADDPVFGFVPSDFHLVYRVLTTVRERHLAPGPAFCEWGSGIGVVTLLAVSLGFDGCGIEADGQLVEEAEELATAFDIPAEFVHGSFIPEGGEVLADHLGEFAWLDTHAPSAYDDLGVDADDFDVVFAYPWPGEEDVIIDLFERYAAVGALLVTYQGVESVHVRRKVAG